MIKIFRSVLVNLIILTLFLAVTACPTPDSSGSDGGDGGTTETVATPTISPAEGTYSSDQSVEITCSTDGSTIHYTTDGSDPAISSAIYAGPISVAGDGTILTIRALAAKSGMNNSESAASTFIINYDQVSTPTFAPAEGTYDSDQSVTISCATADVTIYYTIDGSDPTAASAEYSAAIGVAGNGTSITIKALAVKAGMDDSTIASAAYTINYSQVSTPTFSPAAGTFDSDQTVSISCSTAEVTIYYTTNGSDPTISSSEYSGAINVAGHGTNMTIKALAVKAGMTDSTIASGAYTITYNLPEINLKQNTTSIPSGTGSYDFGDIFDGRSSGPVTFTIENLGTSDLSLSGSPKVSIGGTDSSMFSVGTQPSSPIAASGNTSFTIIFSPTGTGAKTATISIINNDSDENPYAFTLNGNGSGNITYGTEYTFKNSSMHRNDVVYLDSTHIIVGYVSSGSSFIVAGKITNGDEITWGSPRTLLTNTTAVNVKVTALDSTRFAVAFSYSKNKLVHNYARAGSISADTTISLGNQVDAREIDGSGSNANAGTDGIDVIALSSSKYIVAYNGWYSYSPIFPPATNFSYYNYARIVTVSGTTSALGSESQIENSGSKNYNCTLSKIDSSHFVVAYEDSARNGQLKVGTADASVSFGSTYTVNNAVTKYISISNLDSAHFVVAYKDDGGNDYGCAKIGTISGSSVSFGSEYTFNEAITNYVSVGKLSDSYFVVSYKNDGNLYGISRIAQVINTNEMGFAPEVIFNTASTSYISVDSFEQGRFVVSYQDNGDGSYGKAIIGQPDL